MKKPIKNRSKSTTKVRDLPKLPKGLAEKVVAGSKSRPVITYTI